MTTATRHHTSEVEQAQLSEPEGNRNDVFKIIEEETSKGMKGFETDEGGAEEGTTSSTETSQATSDEETSGKRPGIDQVLRDVESTHGKESAEVVRDVLRAHTKIRDEWKDQQEALRDELDRVRTLRDTLEHRSQSETQEEDEQDPNDPLSRVTPDQWSLFDRMAEQRGWVRRDDLEAERTQQAAQTYVEKDIDAGLETWGEDFGSRDEDGSFHWGVGVDEDAQNVWDRLHDPNRGLTARDVYVLARYSDLVEKAKKEASRGEQTRDRHAQARRARTEMGSAAVRTQDKIYDRGSKQSFEDVIARAASLSMKDAPPLPQ